MNKLLVFENPDKKKREKWEEGDNLCCFPHPFRLSILGGVSRGKTSIIKNIIYNNNKKVKGQRFKPFKNIYVIHGNVYNSQEYDDIDATMKFDDDELPDASFWNNPEADKNLIIIDDVNFKKKSPETLVMIEKLYTHVSSHCNYSIILAYQSFFDVVSFIIKHSNIFILFKMNSIQERTLAANRIGINKDHAAILFDKLEDTHDTGCIDLTDDTPAKYRKNIFSPLFIE